MKDFSQEDKASWTVVKDDVIDVFIKDGVLNIGNEAFKNIQRIESMEIAGIVGDIGTNVFDRCNKLYDITFEEVKPPTTVEDDVFYESSVIRVHVPEDYEDKEGDIGNVP